ncbi:YafY family protein [Asticcacaulis sp. YBE204]|uniref:helix-turn-helix transcriptional regulator n=1 Tax=Asticcacaulis sp. YBE204 TaxID=1282363 RepID=UPI0003C3CBCB|nr:YafY family protein [Asticcacaulis sp. YBE204]ESQ80227.1 DNA-binding protein [Asticcacaulis sp. YBE204]
MSRAARLLDLLQILRRHRYPVTGEALAQELDISLRTLYRDIDALRGQGADIEAEAGVGFLLRPGFMLPPLMLSHEEIEAIALGVKWVASRTDTSLSSAALNALAKISVVLPDDMRDSLQTTGLIVPPQWRDAQVGEFEDAHLRLIRQALKSERKLEMDYGDVNEVVTARIVWPIALGFYERSRLLVGWCELRGDFRHFRSDRIRDMRVCEQRYPTRRLTLLKQWREVEDAIYARHRAEEAAVLTGTDRETA